MPSMCLQGARSTASLLKGAVLLRDAAPSVIEPRQDIDAHLPVRTLRHVLHVVGLLEEPRRVGDAALEEGRLAGHVLAEATDAHLASRISTGCPQ